MTSSYLQKMTKTRDFDTNKKNVQPGYRNGIWGRKMYNVDNEKMGKN